MWVQVRLSFLTCSVVTNEPLNVSPHLWPKEVCGQNILCLLSTKMRHQSTSMCLLVLSKVPSYLVVTTTVQKVLDLSLNFLSLLWVGSISSTVWQSGSRDQINLMLYPSQWWQPWGYLSLKNVLILLQNVSDRRRQRASNIIK